MAYNFEAALKAGTSPQQITNYLASKGRSQEAETYFNIHPANSESLVSKGIKGIGNYAKSVWSDFGERAKSVTESIGRQAEGKQSGTSTVLQGIGQVAGGVGDIFGEAIKPVVNKAADALSSDPTFQDFANSKTGNKITNTVSSASQSYDQWAKEHPVASKNLESTVNIAALLSGERPAQSAIDSVKGATSKVLSPLTEGAGKVKNLAKQGIEELKPKPQTAEGIAGQITQGGIEDVNATKNALSNIDISKVEAAPKGKKYQVLQDTLNNKVKDLAKAKSDALSSNKNLYTMDKLATKAGDTEHNFVKDALDQLSTYYEKTNNPEGLSKVSALMKKAETDGLTINEIDQIAVAHGDNIKAFNANGEAASGLSKQAAENTRMGVKNTARGLFGDEAYKAVDSQLSDNIRTRDLVEKVSEKANALQQKIIERGWIAKTGNGVGKVLDITTGGALKNFINYFIPRGEGLKTLNALDLESGLQKNLQKLQGLIDSTSEKDLQAKLSKAISEQQAKPEPGITTKSTAGAADLTKKPLPSNIKINNYQSEFPKYFTTDQINRGIKMLKALEQKGKTLDMKAIDSVIKKVKSMADIKKASPGK